MSFTLYYGCMFAGKTSALLKKIAFEEETSGKLLVFKPFVDIRYDKNFVVSHKQEKVPCIRIKHSVEILELVKPDTKVVAIDELQFFDKEIVKVISSLKSDFELVGAGLNKDYLNKPFGFIQQLIEIADVSVELFAKCFVCEEPATHTHRHIKSTELILPGDNSVYEARCKKCWEQKSY